MVPHQLIALLPGKLSKTPSPQKVWICNQRHTYRPGSVDALPHHSRSNLLLVGEETSAQHFPDQLHHSNWTTKPQVLDVHKVGHWNGEQGGRRSLTPGCF
eukprot:CAMPEP_0180698650 /NCGR_PEP_ID=MMETSP1038_2-20121128/4138_1 /TAXON_ID=632150 /ORGANISM="Azadinium spinosum, Strain 3D9" /LENGTH=99 /DNA_ID=CAMNT_0022730235 /DNA_START=90 /DNA_END=389 /DNA_ORIENTATION=-